MGDNKYSVGRLIKSIRASLRLSQSTVCGGLCSLNAFVRMEKGNIEPNPYLVSLFFQRMGIAVNKYGLVFSKKEYTELEKRCEIVRCLKEKNSSELSTLLGEYQKLVKMTKYQEQFVTYAALVGMAYSEKGSVALIEEGLEAIRLTIPDFELDRAEAYHYSRIERALAAYVADKLYENGQKDISVNVLRKLLQNMEQIALDEEEMVHGYPEIACLLTGKLWELGRYEELHYCEKAIKLLHSCQELNGVLTHLKYRLIGWKKNDIRTMSDEEISAWERRIEALEQLERETQVTETFERDIFALLIEESIQGVPLEKLLKSARHSAGVTGAEVSEQICEPESYSRIERGVVKPYMENYQELMRRMGREGYRYYPNVVSDNYEAHLLYREISREVGNFQYEESIENITKLEKMLDPKEILNRQGVQYIRTMVEMCTKRIEAKQAEIDLWNCLHMTVPKNLDWRRYPLNHLETVIINGIAIVYGEQGNIFKAIEILSDLKVICEKNPLFMLNNKLLYFLISYNIVHYLNISDEYEKAAEISKECELLAGQMRASYDYLSFCYFKIWNEEQMLLSKGECLSLIQNTYLSEFKKIVLATEATGQYQVKNIIANHCERFYGLDILLI